MATILGISAYYHDSAACVLRDVSKLRILGQYFQFLGEQKKWWLLPLVVVLLLGVVIV